MKVSRAAVATVAACLTVGLAGAPSASAAAKNDSAKAKSAQSAKTVNRRLSSTRRQLSTTRRQVNTARRNINKLTTDLGAIGRRLAAGEGSISLLLGAAPQLITAVQKLGTEVPPALQALKDGLTALNNGVQTQIVPNLQKLGDFVAAPEYGFGQVVLVQPGPIAIPQPGSFVVTPDIPDTVQQAQTTQQFVASGGPAGVAVLYGVRSGETDGTGAALPAAHCKVTVTNENGDTATTAANPAFNGLPFQPVNTKSALTSTAPQNAGFPFGIKQTGDDKDNTTTFNSGVVVSDGDTYTVGLSCVDLSPDANNPKA